MTDNRPRTEYWTKDDRTAYVRVYAGETVVVDYKFLAELFAELGFVKTGTETVFSMSDTYDPRDPAER